MTETAPATETEAPPIALPVIAYETDAEQIADLLGGPDTIRHTIVLRSGETLHGRVTALVVDPESGKLRWLAFERGAPGPATSEGVLVERVRWDAVDYIGRREPVVAVVVAASTLPPGTRRIAPEDFVQALVGVRAQVLTAGIPSLPGQIVSITRAVDGGGGDLGYWAVQIRHDGRDYYDEYAVPVAEDAGLLVAA